MRSISLRTLLLLVAAVAFCVVVLVRPSLFWSRLALSTAFVFVGWSLVLALLGNGASRRFGIASAIFAGGYLAIALHESPSQYGSHYVSGRSLITHQGLERLASLIGHSFPTNLQDFSLWDNRMFATSSSVAVPFGGNTTSGAPGLGTAPPTFRAPPGPNPSAQYQYYLIGGHSMLAIWLGSLAGFVAARWLVKRENAAAP